MKKRELGYNGWANHATWLVAVWDYIDLITEQYFENGEKPEDVNDRGVEEIFMSYVDGDMPRDGILSDFMSNAMSQVDWREIASHVEEQLADRIMDDF
jgi:hypothetical protein